MPDNAGALILHHDRATREVVLHPKLHALAKHWSFRIQACAPYLLFRLTYLSCRRRAWKLPSPPRRLFYSLREAEIIIESWRRHSNAVRPHASVVYRLPAPEVMVQTFAAWATVH